MMPTPDAPPAGEKKTISPRDAAFARSLVLYEDDEVLALHDLAVAAHAAQVLAAALVVEAHEDVGARFARALGGGVAAVVGHHEHAALLVRIAG